MALLGAAPRAPDACAALRDLAIAGLTITTVERVGDACHIAAVARPRPTAAIVVEVWLPPPARWSGRYYQMGNGGFAGHIDRATLQAAAARGDAAAATDTGHQGDGFDARWAQGRPDLIEDYASRSIKVTADLATALVRAYYGAAARRRYFMGCSYGGRQALVAASRWPRDWDGVIAGAPAADWPQRLAGFARIQHALRETPGGWLPPDRIATLAAIVHGRRGDAVAVLRRACRMGHTAACLSTPQAASLAAIATAGYPLRDADPAEWARWIVNPDPAASSQLTLATQGFRHVLGADPAWTIAAPAKALPGRTALFPYPDLRAFFAHGGKLLSYFGTADAVLPPGFAVSDARRFGARTTDYRLFLIPGMAHCQGGASAHAFGQSLPAPALADDRRHDARRMLESWVEQGVAPNELVAATVAPGPRRTVKLHPALLAR